MGDLGVGAALDITPGMPMLSMIWLRMNAPFNTPKETHMPRVATYQFDTQGLQLISEWITSIQACP